MPPCKLGSRVRAAGVTSVQGPLRYDDTFLDRVTTIPQHGIRPRESGRSALTIDRGHRRNPARDAAQRLRDALAKAGVSIGNSVTPAAVSLRAAGDPGGRARLSDIAELARSTNQPSDNFLAEMLLKDLGGAFERADPPREGST